ncbi:MAG: Fic family protein [Chlorobi bacterium]|nr:Fic family protein [Chlorobiota bacterium]
MQNILKTISELRKNNVNLIAVSNSEWLSLFRDEIRNSIAIEGVFTNRNELLQVLQNSNRTLDQKAAAILGYFEAASSIYEYGNNLFKENEFSVRISDIKQIHTLLMRYEKQIGSYRGELGAYRKEVVQVTESTFTPLNPFYISNTMKIFLKWLNQNIKNKEVDRIRLAALSHLLFETIHPFRDGNGRVGRIFLSFLLIGFGYLNIAIKGTQKRDRDKYYAALERGDDNFEKMMRKIETGFELKISDIDNYAKKVDSSLLEKIIKDRLSDSVDRLKQSKFIEVNYDAEISLKEAAKFFNYSQDYLRNLINNKKLKARKKGKLWFVKISEIDKYVKERK